LTPGQSRYCRKTLTFVLLTDGDTSDPLLATSIDRLRPGHAIASRRANHARGTNTTRNVDPEIGKGNAQPNGWAGIELDKDETLLRGFMV